jgi:hypothetical protein
MARIVADASQKSVSRAWVGDFLDREHLIAGGAKLDAAQFSGEKAVKVVVGAAGALANATSVPVAALAAAIPSGTLLDFGTTKFARLTAAAAAAATSLTVAAIPTALVSGDTATYIPAGAFKTVPSGTVIGRTYTERDANTAFGPAADADDEVYLVVFDVVDVATLNDVALYRPGSIVKENLLGTFAALSSTLKSKIRSTYVCVRGAN